MPLMVRCFIPLAVFTTAHEVLNLGVHTWLIKALVTQFNDFIHSHVTSDLAIMLASHDQFLQQGIFGDPDFAFVKEHSIFVYISSKCALKSAIINCLRIQILSDRIISHFGDNFFF